MSRMIFVARSLALLAVVLLGSNGNAGEIIPPSPSSPKQKLAGPESTCKSARQPVLIMAPSDAAPDPSVHLEGKELNCGETYELVVTHPDGKNSSETLTADSNGQVQSPSSLKGPLGGAQATLYDSSGQQVAQTLYSYNAIFRYGHLTWRPVGDRTAEFSVVNVFRRSNYWGSGPDGLVVTGDTFQDYIGYTQLCFGDYSCTGALLYEVLSYSAEEDWVVARAITPSEPHPLPGTGVTVTEAEPNDGLDTHDTIQLGDDYSSTIDPPYDLDYVRFTLTQRTAIELRTILQTLGDSYLYLYDSNGVMLAANDDGGGWLSSLIQITLEPGTYYAVAAAYSSGTGQQLVQLRELAAPAPGLIHHTYYEYPEGPFTASLTGCCRIDTLANPSSNYLVQTVVDFARANSAPVSTLPPIVDAPANTPDFTFQIPATDADGDELTFRLATDTESYIANPPPGLTVSSTGQVSWDTTGTVGGQLWAVQVIIEEHRDGELIGSSAVDFLVRITGDRGTAPLCVPPAQAHYTVLAGSPIQFTIGTQDPDALDLLTLSADGLPWWGPALEPPLPLQGHSGIGTTFTWTPSRWDVGYTYNMLFTVTDSTGQQGQCPVDVTVEAPDNWPPEANAGQDQWTSEGSTVTLDGSGSYDPDGEIISYHWSLLSSTGPAVTLSSDTSATPSFTPSDNGVYTFQLTVTDNQGASRSDTVVVNVNNVDPQLSVTVSGPIDEGQVFTATGTIVDPGTSDTWTAQVNYGDEDGFQPLTVTNGTFTLNHRYLDNPRYDWLGGYSVMITVTDDDGGWGYTFVTAVVHNVAPVITSYPSSFTVDQGQSLSVPVSFADPGADYWLGPVEYGDGSTDWIWLWDRRDFTLQHTYRVPSTYSLRFQLMDDDGGETQWVSIPVTVRNVAPTVTLHGGTVNEGSTFSSAGSFSDPGGYSENFTLTVDYGDGTGTQPLSTSYYDRYSFTLSHTYAENGTYLVTVTATDSYGGVGQSTVPVIVNNVAPLVYVYDSYYSYPEGSVVSIQGSFTDPGADTWTATVDYGDGTGVQPLALTGKTFSMSHAFPNNGTYTVTVTVMDDDGGVGSGTGRVSIYNISPTVSVTGGTVDEGTTFTSSGSFADPGADTWTATVNYGDGTGTQPLVLNGKAFSLQHFYANSGSYYVTVAVRDSDGAAGSSSAYVTVRNVLPVVTVTGGTVNEGSTFTASGSFTDPGAERSWSASVTYGDGSSSQSLVLTGNSFTLSHVYADNGTYTVTVRVVDDTGAGTGTAQVVVLNVAPGVTATGGTANEGSSLTLSASITDPSSLDTTVAQIDYGDGSAVETRNLGRNRSFTMSHRYVDNGTYPVTISVTDDDGGVGTTTVPVQVLNVAPRMVAYLSTNTVEGSQYVGIGQFSDPGADTWTITMDYGDGSVPQQVFPDPNSSSIFHAPHVYANSGSYKVTMTVTDDDGGVGTFTVQVGITNVTPVVSATGGTVDEGSTFTSAGSFTDPGADTWTARANYGDGSGWQPLELNGKTFALAHRYANSGSYSVSISVRDSDGAEGTTYVLATVRNVVPVVNFTGGIADEGSAFVATISFTDPGTESSWRASVDYGDGSPVQTLSLTSRTFTLSHVYAENGSYTVNIQVSDDSGTGSASAQVVVLNVAPTVALQGCDTINEGSVCQGQGQISDPGPDTWTVTVDYGDGSAPEQVSLTPDHRFTVSHLYDDNGVYSMTVTVTDDDGGVGTAVASVQVLNVAPTVTASNDSPRYWGVPVSLSGTATDPSQADTQAGFTALWALGDGTTASGLTTTHAYAAPGTYSAQLSVADKDGGATGTGSASTSVAIQQRPSTVTCADVTAVFGFPAVLRAEFVDGLAGGQLGGRSLSFRLGTSTILGTAATGATGLATVQSPGELMPGSYSITVSFAGDSLYTAAEASCTLTITQSTGLITGGGLRLGNKSRGGFNVTRGEDGTLQGELQFQNDTVSFHAHTMTALGLSVDTHQGWFAGVGDDGKDFTAYVEDNGEPGNTDVFKLWIDGVLETSEGPLSGGNIQIH